MMSCKKSTHLLSEQLDRRLTRRETMSLRFHLMMCIGCRNFKENMAFVRAACAHVVGQAAREKP